RGPQEAAARQTAALLGERCRAAAGDDASIRVLGPGTAPIARLRGEHRFQLQLQAPAAAELQAVVRTATHRFQAPDDVRWTVDVDPWDML
ncbi:MAG TPA: primosomal protein N', partial [Lacipirellulaceae bacterium]|nr:primosomal protein N' [Lacipirellulaceae bacterium]